MAALRFLFILTEFIAIQVNGLVLEHSNSESKPESHENPLLRQLRGTVVAGKVDGESYRVFAERKQLLAKNLLAFC